MGEYTGFTPISGLTTTTDAWGFFEFSGLTDYDGVSLYVKVTKDGYVDTLSGNPQEMVTSHSTVFLSIRL